MVDATFQGVSCGEREAEISPLGPDPGHAGVGMEPRLTIDRFIESDERLLWADRFNPGRPRRRLVSFSEILTGEGHSFFALAMGALGAAFIAVIEAGSRLGWFAALVVVVLTPAAVLYGRRLGQMLSVGAIDEVDFLLTDRRVLAYAPKDKASDALSVDRILAVKADGRTLTLTLANPDDKAELRDLADIDEAVRAFKSVLGQAP